MLGLFERLFNSTMYAPHGICLLWEPELIWLHVVSDALIALAYFSIPFALAIFVSKRSDVEFGWVFWAFAIFITACGITHLVSIYTLWVPIYGIEGIIKAITALASIVTAAMLWPLLPRLLAIPSPSQLREAHAALESEASQRREAEQMLRQSQKMEAIGQLTGGVAHDFNNLLMIVSGSVERLKRRADSADLMKPLQMIESAVRKGESLTRQLLSFARRQNLAPKPLDLVDTVQKFSEVLKQSVGPTIDVRLSLPSEPIVVKIDPDEFEIALLNLTLNARDAMPDGGRITVTVDTAQADAGVSHAVVIVQDTGSGIPDDIRERIFEPFFTTKKVNKGTGLGLSQVYGFIQQSDGNITVESQMGKGTAFRLTLPLSHEHPQSNVVPPASRPQLRQDATVLLVEDHPDVAIVATDYLAQSGYNVILAETAEAALAILKQRTDIDLIVSDIVMPGMNGIEFGRVVRQHYASTPIILASGYSDQATKALSEGFRLLQKPYSLDALQRALAEVRA
jgi:signal transduction histidine kinase/CheY-like chemotaxis protein